MGLSFYIRQTEKTIQYQTVTVLMEKYSVDRLDDSKYSQKKTEWISKSVKNMLFIVLNKTRMYLREFKQRRE